jgi:hypothetical protein
MLIERSVPWFQEAGVHMAFLYGRLCAGDVVNRARAYANVHI